ncbi:MAG: hypothetical protein Q8Q32_02125 [bacterium]|nr:hypothetical protein [bacterium]
MNKAITVLIIIIIVFGLWWYFAGPNANPAGEESVEDIEADLSNVDEVNIEAEMAEIDEDAQQL